MKKTLLLGALALLIASSATATAPVKRSDAKVNRTAQLQRKSMPNAEFKTNTMRTPGTPVLKKAPKKEAFLENWYVRPAGAFYVDYISVDGSYGYAYSSPFLYVKPFAEYTYKGVVTGADENTHVAWDIFKYGAGDDNYIPIDDEMEPSVAYNFELSETPKFYAVDGEFDDPNAAWYTYQIVDHSMGGNDENPVVESETPVQVFSVPSDAMISGDANVDYWCSSKTMVGGGRNGDQYYTLTAYRGADPYPGNEFGWWFGKNGEHIDGMGQAFEKPSKPYLLKKVGMTVATSRTVLNEENVKLKCHVYKLNDLPEYNDTAAVVLPPVPGELIVSGEANLNQAVLDENYGFVEFTLFGEDEDIPGLTYEYTPTIDCPILVTIDGYNEVEGLQEFTTYISADDQVDEGHGELAYLKYPRWIVRLDENGDTVKENDQVVYDWTGEYIGWRGLNNFFSSGQMKTAFSIYTSVENPFVVFNYGDIENGQHTFPNEGGDLVKDVEVEGETYQIEGIDFYSWIGSDGGDWILTCNGSDELPDWLDIELEDVEGNDEDGWEVFASVTAQPLPENVPYREAVVRFEIPGDYIEYKFMQGEQQPYAPEDVNRDGEITVADVNAAIKVILEGTQDLVADANQDGEVSVADVNRIIAKITGQI